MFKLRRLQPLVFAVVAALAMVAAILAYVLTPAAAATNDAQTFTDQESAAVAAAQTEVANLATYRRASFDADFQRALNGLTGSALIDDIKKNKATTLKTITDGKFDLSAKVTHAALVGPVDDDKVTGYIVLVSLNGYRSTAQNSPTQQNLQVTVVKKSNKWLVSAINSIGVST